MRSREQIQKEMQKGDYQRIAYIVGVSEILVQKVIYGTRKDNQGIIEAFNKIIDQRQMLEVSMRQEYKNKKIA